MKKIRVWLDRGVMVWAEESLGIFAENGEAIDHKFSPLLTRQLKKFKEQQEYIEKIKGCNISNDEHLARNREYLRMGRLLQKYLGEEYDVDIVFNTDKIWWDKEKDCILYEGIRL